MIDEHEQQQESHEKRPGRRLRIGMSQGLEGARTNSMRSTTGLTREVNVRPVAILKVTY